MLLLRIWPDTAWGLDTRFPGQKVTVWSAGGLGEVKWAGSGCRAPGTQGNRSAHPDGAPQGDSIGSVPALP
ncbi:hypothetical protein AV530_017886 [Patagioenas fasciata monilis]|uniref:Uncharacterized protein n=1 Tax=Patagioenas fasciata monilis TaxID=372326 RepID=A0A1V4JVY9_PATFA|nr:hypothetical protein AV530_017886 [Patagioenas fasciata monilis]